jgi:hypothetical protein
MRRRERDQAAMEAPPAHLQEFDPDRYRKTALQSLRDHPGDVWCAAMSVWRKWQHECQEWQAERGIVRGVKGYRRQLGPGRPPLAWVCDEFALPVNEETTQCGARCRVHGGLRLR